MNVPSLPYDLKSPESGMTTPGTVSIEPNLRVSDEAKLPDKEGLDKDLESVETSPTATVVQDDDPPPEGGRGWWVLLGSFLLTFSVFGLVDSWVFQCLYEESVLPNTSPSAIAWIGSIQYALCFMPGLLSGRLFDLGYLHTPLAVASIVQSLATILVAECTEYWHFLVTQGLVTGLANGFIYGPAMPIVSHWFRKRRATGIGIVAAGAAVGGSVVSIVVRQLLPVVGRKWTMRIVGIMLLVVQGVANMLVTRRLPATNHPGGLINPRAFKSIPYSLYVLGAFVGFLGMYTPLTFIDVSAVRMAHLDPNFGFYLVAITNASSLIARVGGGLCGDMFGIVNIMAGLGFVAAVTTFVWPMVTTKAGMLALAITYGGTSTGLVGLLAAPVAKLGDTADVGRRTGMMFTIVSFGSLIGPPISGAIYAAKDGFMEVGIYAGCTIVMYVAILVLVKISAVGTWKGKF